MRCNPSRRRGQALMMVTLVLFSMVGLIGLAVDLGWLYFVRKAAQAAADAAALAAAKNALKAVGPTGDYSCGNPAITCQPTPASCASITSGNLLSGCLYAQQNGFAQGGNSGRQAVMMQADASSPFVTATGPVTVHYWVTATVKETVPQLFSAVLGNTLGTSGAKATAAIADAIVDGALILLNRQYDRARMGNVDVYGLDLNVQANDNHDDKALQTAGNIRMSSTCAGVSNGPGHCLDGNKATWAGVNQGGGTIYTLPAGTKIRFGGWYDLQGSSQWISTPVNANGAFDDPMAGKGQPPPPSGSLPNWEFLGGTIEGGGENNPKILAPGNYYATETVSCGSGCTQTVASGEPLQITGDVKFSNQGTGFGNWVIFGGIKKGSGAGNVATVTFDPGLYVLAGARPGGGGAPGALLDADNNFILKDRTEGPGQNSDAGELFVLTDPGYPGLALPPLIQAYQTTWRPQGLQLQFGTVNLQAGNNGTYINVHGLNKRDDLVRGTPLETFAPGLIWQDQRNSFVTYNSDGTVNTSCGSLDQPCTNSLLIPDSPALLIQASPAVHLYGTVYQPRGAWTILQGGGGYSGPLQLITGALHVQGNANINLTAPTTPSTITIAALIE